MGGMSDWHWRAGWVRQAGVGRRAVGLSEAEIAALVAVGEALVVDAERVHDGGERKIEDTHFLSELLSRSAKKWVSLMCFLRRVPRQGSQ